MHRQGNVSGGTQYQHEQHGYKQEQSLLPPCECLVKNYQNPTWKMILFLQVTDQWTRSKICSKKKTKFTAVHYSIAKKIFLLSLCLFSLDSAWASHVQSEEEACMATKGSMVGWEGLGQEKLTTIAANHVKKVWAVQTRLDMYNIWMALFTCQTGKDTHPIPRVRGALWQK